MNWKLRFKNKQVLTALVLAVIAFVYQLFGMFGLVPAVSESEVVAVAGLVINILVGLGVLIDPTTAGIGDSEQALTYAEPKERGDKYAEPGE